MFANGTVQIFNTEPYFVISKNAGRGGPHSLIGNGLSILDTPFCEYSHTNFLLVITMQIHGRLHIIEVDSEVLEGGNDVLVTEYLGDRFYGCSGMVHCAAEGPSEGMVGKSQSEAVTHNVYDSAVDAVSSVGISSGLRYVLVVAPEEHVARIHP